VEFFVLKQRKIKSLRRKESNMNFIINTEARSTRELEINMARKVPELPGVSYAFGTVEDVVYVRSGRRMTRPVRVHDRVVCDFSEVIRMIDKTSFEDVIVLVDNEPEGYLGRFEPDGIACTLFT
jgi:hypothetical protein